MTSGSAVPVIPYPLRTPRLLLRRFTADDLAPYHAYQRLPETAAYLLNAPRTYTESMARIARYVDAPFEKEGDWASFAIEDAHRPGLLGEIALKWGSGGRPETGAEPGSGAEPGRVGEIGWTLAPAARSRGYATEAAQAVLDLAFGRLGFRRLEARLDSRNTASAAICLRLGMVPEGVLRENAFIKGDWTSEAIFAVLRPAA
jgi:RimJ/RimL family protein N-acetyltransferase